MQHTRSTCGPNSRGRCKVLKRSSPGGHLRSDLVSLSGPSNTNAGALLRSPGPGPMVDGVAKSSSFRVSKPHRRVGVDAPHSELRTSPDFVGEGGLLAYGASRRRLFIRSAYYVKRILEGARASDLPVEQPTRVELWINVRTAKALKLVVPTTLLAQADQIIE